MPIVWAPAAAASNAMHTTSVEGLAMPRKSAMTAAFGIFIAAITVCAQGPAPPPAPWRGAGATPCVGTDGGIYQCPQAPRTIAVRAGRLFDSKTGQMLTR